MAHTNCMYGANGFLICETPLKNNATTNGIKEDFMICPPGSWTSRCSLECKSGVMLGTCKLNSQTHVKIPPFETQPCQGKDIYFDLNSKSLRC